MTGSGTNDEHEKQNQKNRGIPQLEDESTNGISFNWNTPFNSICVELLKKMMKELEQNKEELRKMKESFDSKLEEMEKDNSWSRKVNPSGEVRVSFFFLNAWHWS